VSETEFDVIVIGGGPGGTTVATFLQREGHRCVVLEGTNFPRYRIGESLIPYSYGTLKRLGLIPKMQASEFTPKHSVRFVSPGGAESEPFYFTETIAGDAAQTWQVERGAFDQLCLDHAVEEGVTVRLGERVEEVLFEGEQAVGVRTRSSAGVQDLKARVVVDASGRATVIGRQLDLLEAIPSLRKVSVWSYFKGGLRGEGRDAGETTILLLPDNSWAWHVPADGGRE